MGNAITRHAVLPVIHAAWKLTVGARALALVIPPQELREREDGEVVTDLDIVLVRDGQFVLGEVKSSPNAFDEEQLGVLLTVAQEIRPQVFVLAAPGTEWPPETTASFQEFEAALIPFDVKVERILLEW